MFDATERVVIRRSYARQICFSVGVQNAALEKAFAEVPREAFLGAGPWPVFRWTGYTQTPDADPAWLYADTLIGLKPERGLNNGQPSAHAAWIAAAAPAPGDHVVHVGAGAGYYSAIMRQMTGPSGSLTAIEIDPDLAQKARENLSDLTNVQVLQEDGATAPLASAAVIYVNAGASRPADVWLEALQNGGRLILPLTTTANFPTGGLARPSGAVFRITRHDEDFAADFISPVVVFPCAGARDEISEHALAQAFEKGGIRDVKRLRRTSDVPDDECWVKAPGWSLTYC
jgi:protein-L-isoaspartate(D-aspartate) O-methyltransferase